MGKDKYMAGHGAACLTVLIWGTTFISTKILLKSFTPMEILFLRFLMGYAALWIVSPKRLRLSERGQETYFAAAGLCGVTLYYLLENVALTFTLASNVGVIISVAPFFTAVLSGIFLKERHLGKRFFAGFALAMAGICLISFSSRADLAVNPMGDLLALGAAALWAVYSILTRKISGFGYPTVLATRHTFFYGLLFMAPIILFTGLPVTPQALFRPESMFHLLFLGLGASALCFVTWNFAVRQLGAVKTSVYIYMVPVITTVFSAAALKETITAATAVGILLTLLGLGMSEGKTSKPETEPTKQPVS